ncbi:MAG: thiamine phosphate synthase [Campylobacterales bacterium]|nr:thiamine phosphate synthase [Campylobacterales bacterium]
MIAYAISDPFTLDFNNLEESLRRFSSKASMILYRDKSNPNYSINAKLFLAKARKYSFDKILLHGDIELAIALKADGVHLRSDQFAFIAVAKENKLFVVVSTHSLQEAKLAQDLGADMVTISPVFSSPNKGKPIGLNILKEVCDNLKIPVIALGGITSQEEIDAIMEQGAAGFASIRYFK